MALFNSLTFDSQNSLTYGVYITGEGVFNAPERAMERVSIPGRNGDLILDYGRYENIEVTYPAGVFGADETTFATKIMQFRNVLTSRYTYKRLTDTYHTDEFRLAVFRGGLEVDPVQKTRAGEFDIVFDCKPQRFLTSGESTTTFTADGTISNPTAYPSRPLITVTGNGTLVVNGVSMVIGGSSNTVIDCELMECYDGANSKNGDVVMTPNQFPVLDSGSNTIDLSTGITKVEIVPRWWRL